MRRESRRGAPASQGEIADGKFYARGCVDNKGTLVNRLEAVRAWVAPRGQPSATVKFLFQFTRGLLQGTDGVVAIRRSRACPPAPSVG